MRRSYASAKSSNRLARYGEFTHVLDGEQQQDDDEEEVVVVDEDGEVSSFGGGGMSLLLLPLPMVVRR